MVTSNVGPFAKEYKVAEVLVLGMAALPLSLTLSRVTNGLTRPFFGWVSDHIGREMTMALAFSLEAVAILVLFAFIDQPALFVVLTGLVFFGWGEIFSLFPSTLTDTFGPKYAATNYGFLYIAQGVGSILGGPAAAFLKQMTGSWTAVFIIVAALDILTALLAITCAARHAGAAHQGGLIAPPELERPPGATRAAFCRCTAWTHGRSSAHADLASGFPQRVALSVAGGLTPRRSACGAAVALSSGADRSARTARPVVRSRPRAARWTTSSRRRLAGRGALRSGRGRRRNQRPVGGVVLPARAARRLAS